MERIDGAVLRGDIDFVADLRERGRHACVEYPSPRPDAGAGLRQEQHCAVRADDQFVPGADNDRVGIGSTVIAYHAASLLLIVC